jgi:hypothetical protein
MSQEKLTLEASDFESSSESPTLEPPAIDPTVDPARVEAAEPTPAGVSGDTLLPLTTETTTVESRPRMATSATLTCGEFTYGGDLTQLGARWAAWLDRFALYVTANGLKDGDLIRASFLLLIG